VLYAAVAGKLDSSGTVARLAAFSEMANASPAGAAALLRSLYVTAAWAVEAEHQRHKGLSPSLSVQLPMTTRSSSSSSSRSSSNRYQPLKVPSYHTQYLNSCGITWKSNSHEPLPVACIRLFAEMHQQAMETCRNHSSQPAASLALQQQQQQLLPQPQQQQQVAASFTLWRQLQVSQVLPGPEQLLLLLQSTVLQPEFLAVTAVNIWEITLAALDRHNCAAAAAELLLQPALYLLGPAVMHCSAEKDCMPLLLGYVMTVWRLVVASSSGGSSECTKSLEVIGNALELHRHMTIMLSTR
jgi:hypothetical protein